MKACYDILRCVTLFLSCYTEMSSRRMMASSSSAAVAAATSSTSPALPQGIQQTRLRWLNDRPLPTQQSVSAASSSHQQQCVVYWMQRSVRSEMNHALEMAITWANHLDLPLLALYCFVPTYPGANERGFAFLIDGLSEVQASLRRRGIQMIVR